MIFTITWLPSAIQELADLWIHAPDRNAITDSANKIDRLLREDGHVKGQEFKNQKTLYEPPLMITFSVRLDDRLIEVIQVERVSN